jgi:hypothetical protein
MLDNKLIRLLSGFSRREMTRFRDLAASPYFNKHADVRALIAYLSEVFPRFDAKTCERGTIYQALFPGQAHDQGKLAVLFTYAWRLAEEYLVHESLREAPGFSTLLLLRRLRRNKLFGEYEKLLERAKAEAWDEALDRYFWRYKLAEEADHFYSQGERRQEDHSIQEKQDYLDFFYLAEKLKDACEMMVRARILKVRYDSRLLDGALREVGRYPERYRALPPVWMYYQLYRMVAQGEERHYFEALDSLLRYEDAFPNAELKEIYNYFQNYCIEQINRGNARFLPEIFKLYQSQLARGLLLVDGQLSEWHYKNIVTTGIRLRELDWVRQFIETYREMLPLEGRENAYRFNLAAYLYAAGRYSEVLDLLIKVEYSDLRYSLGSKALLLRTYYDLEEYEALFSLADSFRQFLLRNRLLADSRRQGYNNLFRLTRKAATLRHNLGFSSRDKMAREIARLKIDLAKTETIFNKTWLEEKALELEREFEALTIAAR